MFLASHPIIPSDETLRPEAATDTDAAGQQQESRNSCSRSRLRETLDKNLRTFLRPRKITTENNGLNYIILIINGAIVFIATSAKRELIYDLMGYGECWLLIDIASTSEWPAKRPMLGWPKGGDTGFLAFQHMLNGMRWHEMGTWKLRFTC